MIGFAAIVSGGLIAAITRPAGIELGSWLAAYLVLVAGVAQVALGTGQAWLLDRAPTRPTVQFEVVAWNAGVVGTMVGTLASLPIVTTLAGLSLVGGLAVFLRTITGSAHANWWARLGYLALVVLLLTSTPIGFVLAWGRHG
jgi:hypothetical protein